MDNISAAQQFSSLDYISSSACVIDSQGVIHFWNTAIEIYSGTKATEILGTKIQERYPMFAENIISNRIRMLFQNGFPVALSSQLHNAFIVPLGRNADEIDQNMSLTPVFNPDGPIKYVVINISDVTDLTSRLRENRRLFDKAQSEISERKKMQMLLNDLNKDLERRVHQRTSELEEAHTQMTVALDREKELGDMKTRFISTISHEFRTPLTVLMSTTEVLKAYNSRNNDDFVTSQLKLLFDATKKIDHLIDDVITYSSYDEQQMPEFETIRFEDMCNTVFNEISAIDQGTHKFEVECPTLSTMKTAPHLLKEAVINILSNAVKYSPDDTTVMIRASLGNENIFISITDQGPGIPGDQINKIFDPFYKSSDSIGLKSGTGLGLTIAKRSVSMLGGEIIVSSAPGKGSTFTIVLPKQ